MQISAHRYALVCIRKKSRAEPPTCFTESFHCDKRIRISRLSRFWRVGQLIRSPSQATWLQDAFMFAYQFQLAKLCILRAWLDPSMKLHNILSSLSKACCSFLFFWRCFVGSSGAPPQKTNMELEPFVQDESPIALAQKNDIGVDLLWQSDNFVEERALKRRRCSSQQNSSRKKLHPQIFVEWAADLWGHFKPIKKPFFATRTFQVAWKSRRPWRLWIMA